MKHFLIVSNLRIFAMPSEWLAGDGRAQHAGAEYGVPAIYLKSL
jgi:hypothetical protein